MTTRLAACLVAVTVAAASWQAGAAPPQPRPLFRHEATRLSMACVYAIEAYGPDAQRLPQVIDEAFDEVDRIDRLMSHYRADSAVSRLNREAARRPISVAPELFDFIQTALSYTHDSGGAFDITVGPLMKAWGFFRGDGHLPSAGELAAARRHVGGRHVKLDRAARTIAFDEPGVEIDLGGIAKGYAVDRVAALLRERQVESAVISAGGSSVYGLGAPPGREAWEVAIEDPVTRGKTARTIRLKDRALSVAGSAEKSFEAGGVTYAHIMDPRSGWPVQGVLSVAVLAPSATAGDALDNAFFVLGAEGSRAYLRAADGRGSRLLPAEGESRMDDGPIRWRHMVKGRVTGAILGGLLSTLPLASHGQQRVTPDLEAAPFAPRRYVAYRTASRPTIDGKLDEAAWAAAAWTDAFVDIEGDRRPRPRFATRAKMLWDDEHFYVAAEMEEPDLWGTLTVRDSVIFHDNDFEIFIDPDGDTHAYYELEVNALEHGVGSDAAEAVSRRRPGDRRAGTSLACRSASIVRGTLNRPGDRDDGWTVEIAMPWRILREAAPDRKRAAAGRPLARQLLARPMAAGYRRRPVREATQARNEGSAARGQLGLEPAGRDQHAPARALGVCAVLRRAGRKQESEPFVEDPNEHVKWALRRLYYRQRAFREKSGGYASTLAPLAVDNIRVEGLDFRPTLTATASLYEIVAAGFGGATVHIDQDGRVWMTK